MSNEHIGRRQAIGIGKESTSGTAVAASIWVPKVSGSFSPKFVTARDEAAYGVIDKVKEVQTVQTLTEVQLSANIGHLFFGHLLTAAFGQGFDCVKFPISGITGTFTVGETVTESVSSATGVLRRSDQGAGTPALYIDPVSGTFTGGQTLTGGTSSATATGGTIQSPASIKDHVFRLLNNNTHASYTIYGNDPIGDERAVHCMLDQLEIECLAMDFAKFSSTFIGKKLATTTAQTPSYTAQFPFLGKFATFKLASAFNSLDAASATKIDRFRLTFSKNTVAYQAFGATDAESIHNQAFEVSGEFELLYNATTQRDLVTNSTKQALRLTLTNTDQTIGSSTNPSLQLDFPVVSFEEWDRTEENDGLVRQTLRFVAEYDVTRALTCEALLRNTSVVAY